ncbi:hypothetical protein ACFE04_015265 [Oxalis oulophora]
MASAESQDLIIIIFFSLIIFSSSSSSHVLPSNKVSLGVFYESLCPYCANFIINHLAKLFTNENDDLISTVHLNLVPWGNAKLIKPNNNTFTCQHGKYECLLNTVEACAIDAWSKLEEHFAFINCVETFANDRKSTQWEECFEKLGLDSKPVYDCLDSGYGTQICKIARKVWRSHAKKNSGVGAFLELKYAAETDKLQPPHKYVPWIVVDGQPLYEDYENFISYICEAYKGTALPTACSELKLSQVSSTGSRKDKVELSVCYRDDNPILQHIRSAVTSGISWLRAAAM